MFRSLRLQKDCTDPALIEVSDGSGPEKSGQSRARAFYERQDLGLDGPWNFTMYSSQKVQIFQPFPKSQAPGLLGRLRPFTKSRASGLPKNTGLGPGLGLGPDPSLIEVF